MGKEEKPYCWGAFQGDGSSGSTALAVWRHTDLSSVTDSRQTDTRLEWTENGGGGGHQHMPAGGDGRPGGFLYGSGGSQRFMKPPGGVGGEEGQAVGNFGVWHGFGAPVFVFYFLHFVIILI